MSHLGVFSDLNLKRLEDGRSQPIWPNSGDLTLQLHSFHRPKHQENSLHQLFGFLCDISDFHEGLAIPVHVRIQFVFKMKTVTIKSALFTFRNTRYENFLINKKMN
jgi:hypothetical protein